MTRPLVPMKRSELNQYILKQLLYGFIVVWGFEWRGHEP